MMQDDDKNKKKEEVKGRLAKVMYEKDTGRTSTSPKKELPDWTKQEPGSIVLPEHNKQFPKNNSPSKQPQKKIMRYVRKMENKNSVFNTLKENSKENTTSGEEKSKKNTASGIKGIFGGNAIGLIDDSQLKVDKKYQDRVNKILGR